MYKRIFTFMFALLIVALFNANITKAQPTKTTPWETYPVISIAPVGGVQFPVGGLNDVYNASFNAGLDIGLKVNKETAFYLNATYFNMPRKGNVAPGPDGAYISITAGPRYIFATPKLKAKFFLEAGIGVYIFNSKEYTLAAIPPSTSATVIASTSTANFGVNVGPGVIIPLGQSMDMLMKTKMHYTFETGGSHTFISAVVGLDFKL